MFAEEKGLLVLLERTGKGVQAEGRVCTKDLGQVCWRNNEEAHVGAE